MVTDFKKNKKNQPSKRLLFKIGVLVFLVFSALMVIADVRIYKKRQLLTAELTKLQNQIKAINDKNAQLEQGINQVGNPEYIEKVAREELDLQKPGEKIVSFTMPSETPKPEQQKQQGWLDWVKAKLEFWK